MLNDRGYELDNKSWNLRQPLLIIQILGTTLAQEF
jgi:hypothetical protein